MKILLVRLSAMGDIVFASALVPAFRRRYPDATLCWLVAEPFADLLRAERMLDEVIVLPTRHWRRLVGKKAFLRLGREVRAFVRGLRARHFDLALDLQGLLKSGIWTWLTGAPRRIGLGSREGTRYLMTRIVDRHGGRPERIASEYLHLAGELGLDVDDFAMRVPVDDAARARASELLAQEVGDRRFGVICPFTTRPQKHWVEAYWAELVPRLVGDFGRPVVMLGGPADRAAAAVLAGTPGLIDLVGRTDIPAAAAVIERADYVIGVDTGLTHMGIALRKPTLCLFGSTRPYTDTAAPEARVLYDDLPCAPCRRHPTCNGRFDCMRALTPQRVRDALAELLGPGI